MRIVLIWWGAMLLMGVSVLPFSYFIFRKFRDCGWLFAKPLGLFVSAWILWTFNVIGAAEFTDRNIYIVLIGLMAVNYGAYVAAAFFKKGNAAENTDDLLRALFKAKGLILLEEALFFGLFALCTYIVGFKPEAYGTEKFMDYGFMTSMMRSLTMPFADMWYAGKPINYYYGGQYIAAMLTKLTDVTAGEGYNLMRALLTAGSYVLPFGLVYQLLADYFGDGAKKRILIPGGLLGGTAVAFCGNFHYVIYGIILPIVRKIQGVEYSYWFPDSTRYIGYNPDRPDKTIHEFPAYSSVLGDLHAHYLNIMFVLLVVAVVYAWALKRRESARQAAADAAVRSNGIRKHRDEAEPGEASSAKQQGFKNAAVAGDPAKRKSYAEIIRTIFCPEVLLIGFMTGVFRWTNFWDFPIYYVTCGSIFFFVLLIENRRQIGRFAVMILGIAAVMFAVGSLAARPFTATFFQISSEVARTHSHTPFYQLLILWGLPAAVLIGFAVSLAKEAVERARGRQLRAAVSAITPDDISEGETAEEESSYSANVREGLKLPDLAVLLFGLCAAGLVFLPEVIYVVDIYSGDHYRANTMFKLTYQAFILFGIMMSYVLVRTLAGGRRRCGTTPADGLQSNDSISADGLRSSNMVPAEDLQNSGAASAGAAEEKPPRIRLSWYAALAGTVLLLLTGGYIIQSCYSWFGSIFILENRVNTDASVFVSESFPSDFNAINYLNGQVGDQPIIVEAQGDSYTGYERVSVATGLPTIVGWYVHEWLWRQDLAELNERVADVEAIYSGTDPEEVAELLRKYDVSYIYVGMLEREKYPNLRDEVLEAQGEVVFADDGAYIVKVQ